MTFLINRSHMSLPHPKYVPIQNIETKRGNQRDGLISIAFESYT